MASFEWPPLGSGGGSGTVTNVGLTVPSALLSVTPPSITSSGTFVVTLNTENANTVFAGPASGVAATPTFRSLVVADLPLTFGNLTDVGTDGIVVGNGTGAVIGSGTTIAQHVADTTHNGYLSSTDWNTFNGKQAALIFGNLTDVGTDGITVGNGTGSVIGTGTTISQHVAGASNNGYLSSTDWNTFNGKQTSGSYITALTGDVTASGPGSVAATLATVNTNVGSFNIADITVNAKGLITAASASAVTGTGNVVLSASPTLTGTIGAAALTLSTALAVASGGTGVGSVTTTPAATAFAGWDANKNLKANNFLEGYTTTATAAATTTLTVSSTHQQYFTGTTTQTVVMPVTSTLVLGQQFFIFNQSTGVITVESSGANVIQTVGPGGTLALSVISTGVTTAAGWSKQLLFSKIICSGNQSTQTFTSGGPTQVTGWTTNIDTASGFASNAYTVPTGSYLTVYFQLGFALTALATDSFELMIFKNGSAIGSSILGNNAANTGSCQCSLLQPFSAGDVITFQVTNGGVGSIGTGGDVTLNNFYITN